MGKMDEKMISKIKNSFFEKFQNEPVMIFSPGRINLIGEHTDYNEGFVFPAAVNKGIEAAISENKLGISRAFAVDKNEMAEFNLKQIHPHNAGNWQNYIFGVVAELSKAGAKL